jgi:hypothetical protein
MRSLEDKIASAAPPAISGLPVAGGTVRPGPASTVSEPNPAARSMVVGMLGVEAASWPVAHVERPGLLVDDQVWLGA